MLDFPSNSIVKLDSSGILLQHSLTKEPSETVVTYSCTGATSYTRTVKIRDAIELVGDAFILVPAGASGGQCMRSFDMHLLTLNSIRRIVRYCASCQCRSKARIYTEKYPTMMCQMIDPKSYYDIVCYHQLINMLFYGLYMI